jgi:hypothetical protein
MDEQVWRLSRSSIDAIGKKEIEDFLDFRSREAAEMAIQPFERDANRDTGRIERFQHRPDARIRRSRAGDSRALLSVNCRLWIM